MKSSPSVSLDSFEIAGVKLSTLLEEFHSPFYVYDLDGIRSRARSMRKALPKNAEIFFALKSNSNNHVLRVLREEGLGLDVVSRGEIEKGLKAGFLPSQMVFSGVGKTHEELEQALRLGVLQINVESLEELARISELACRLKVVAPVALRVNPDVQVKTHPYIATGLKENKFGIAVEQIRARELLKLAPKKGVGVEIQGLALHIGSQLLDTLPIETAVKKGLEVYKRLQKQGLPLRTLDVGGGLGISYRPGDPAPTFEDLAEKVLGILRPSANVKINHIYFEPGRYIVGPYGWLVARVEYVKKTPHKNFVIVNTGMHHLIRPALYQSYHRILHLKTIAAKTLTTKDRVASTHPLVADVVGPICESSDVLGRDREFWGIEEMDPIVIADVGAYGAVMASDYNLRGAAQEIAVSSGRIFTSD